MKKVYTLMALGLLASGSAMAQGQSAAPDAYGYTWKSDSVANGPTYNWIDISTMGQEITTLADDNTVGPFNLGFPFRYYWTDISQIRIGSNGYILMGTSGQISSGTAGFPLMPTASDPDNVVAPFLADLSFSEEATAPQQNPGKAYFYTNNTDTAIVSFVDVPFWTNPTDDPNGWSGANTFQVLFLKADSSITFQYMSQSGNWNASYNSVARPMTIGIENITGGIGLNVTNTNKPTAGTAVKFYYPDQVTFSVTDVAAGEIQNDLGRGFFGVVGVPMNMSTTVKNVGNQDIAGPINVRTHVRKASATGAGTGPFLFDQTAPVTNLNEGDQAIVNYTLPFAPLTLPTGNANPSYVVTTIATLTGDQNPTNNTTTNEMVVLDTTGTDRVLLRYDDGTPEGSLGFEGGAVYFEPPFYPVDIHSLRFFLVAAAGATPTNGYRASIWDNSGPNGGPGSTPLFTQTLQPADIILTSYNNIVPLPTPVTINTGGFYVSWEATGGTQNVFLAADQTGPFSRQTYEVLFGAFGEYRSAEEEDLLIAAEIEVPAAPIGRPEEVTASFNLENVYPNPASSDVKMRFSLAQDANVTVTLTNITGQQVKQVNLGNYTAGTSQNSKFSVTDLSSGVYFMTMKAGNDTVTRKLVITK